LGQNGQIISELFGLKTGSRVCSRKTGGRILYGKGDGYAIDPEQPILKRTFPA